MLQLSIEWQCNMEYETLKKVHSINRSVIHSPTVRGSTRLLPETVQIELDFSTLTEVMERLTERKFYRIYCSVYCRESTGNISHFCRKGYSSTRNECSSLLR